MTAKYNFKISGSKTSKTVNPVRPQEVVGLYNWTDESDIPDSLLQQFLAKRQNGMRHVNHGTVPDNNMPFGGVKNSGAGSHSVGPIAVNSYTSEHAAYIAY